MENEVQPHGKLEEIFESFLFNCRFLVFFAVFGLLAASFVMFLKGGVEVVQGVNGFFSMAHFAPTSADDKNVILSFIPAIDSFLFAAILLIFSMGFYELFVSKIDPSMRGKYTRPDWLVIRNLDDLKNLISELIITVLIINFFNASYSITFDRPIDLLIFGGGIILIALALLLTHYIISKKINLPNFHGK